MKKRISNRKTALSVEVLEERIVFNHGEPTDMTALAAEDYPNGPPSSPAILALNFDGWADYDGNNGGEKNVDTQALSFGLRATHGGSNI